MTGVAQTPDGALWACGAVGATDKPAVGCWKQADRQRWERWDVTAESGSPAPLYSYGLITTPTAIVLTGVGRSGSTTDASVWTFAAV